MQKLTNEKILSIKICSSDRKDILSYIINRIKKDKSTIIFTPNAQMLLDAQKEKSNKKLLNASTVNIPDGAGIIIASKLSGGKIKKRISGIDFAESILSLSEKKGYRIFLLGAKKGVAKKAERKLKKRYPELDICGTHHGYFNGSIKEKEKVIKILKKKKPDIVFVCMGYPMQEKWILQNEPYLPSVKLYIGLGGSIDVWSGNIKRAPLCLQAIGLEWLYRTIKEPKRAKILLDIPIFLFKVLKS